MESRKSMLHLSVLPMVVKVTRASCFLVTTPPKIAIIGASQPLHLILISPSSLHCFEEKTRWPHYMNKVLQSTTPFFFSWAKNYNPIFSWTKQAWRGYDFNPMPDDSQVSE